MNSGLNFHEKSIRNIPRTMEKSTLPHCHHNNNQALPSGRSSVSGTISGTLNGVLVWTGAWVVMNSFSSIFGIVGATEMSVWIIGGPELNED